MSIPCFHSSRQPFPATLVSRQALQTLRSENSSICYFLSPLFLLALYCSSVSCHGPHPLRLAFITVWITYRQQFSKASFLPHRDSTCWLTVSYYTEYLPVFATKSHILCQYNFAGHIQLPNKWVEPNHITLMEGKKKNEKNTSQAFVVALNTNAFKNIINKISQAKPIY